MTKRQALQLTLTVWISISTVTACGTLNADKATEPAPSTSSSKATSPPKAIKVTKVISQVLHSDTRLPGDLVAFRDVGIYPKIAGFVKWIGVDRGSKVKKGQLLIRMTAPEIAVQSRQSEDLASVAKDESRQAKNETEEVKEELVSANAKAKASADTYQRLKAASDYPGIIAGNDLEVAQKTAEADAAHAKALERRCKSLETKQEAATSKHNAAVQGARSNEEMESYLSLSAPFDGVITERNVHEGSFVSPPTNTSSPPLLRLKQGSTLRLVVPVPEADIGGISNGAELHFSVSAFPGETFSGTVKRIAESIDVNTRTMAVELDVNNSQGQLSPGMFAEVLWPLSRSKASLFVPQSAIVKTTERSFVIKVENGVTKWIGVKAEISDGDLVEVFGKLNADDQVVVRGTDELRENTQVQTEEISSTELKK